MIKTNINDLPRVIKITDEAVGDYIKCPQFFYFKWTSKIGFKKSPTFHELVGMVIDIYLAKLMDQKIMTSTQLKRQWDKLIDKYPNVITEKRVLEGFGMINQLTRYCENNRVSILDIGSQYNINFKDNIILTGKIGAIRYNKNKLELFIVETSQKKPDQFLLDMSLKYTMQLYALKKDISFEVAGLHVYHVKSGQEFFSTRSQKDFERLEKTIRKVGYAIREDIFYPREDFTCPTCPYKLYCGFL